MEQKSLGIFVDLITHVEHELLSENGVLSGREVVYFLDKGLFEHHNGRNVIEIYKTNNSIRTIYILGSSILIPFYLQFLGFFSIMSIISRFNDKLRLL